MGENLKKQLMRLRKDQDSFTYDSLLEEIRKSFFGHVPFMPEEMLFDIFNFFVSEYTDARDVYRDFDILSEKLLDLTELFNGNYDEATGTITDSDFDYLKEIVNDFSTELPEEILFYVMKIAVNRGRFK